MSIAPVAIQCPNCGAAYELSAEYVSQYGGQQTQCTKCSKPIPIPQSMPVVAPLAAAPTPVLGYMGANVGEVRGVWREGKLVVASSEIDFPPRCVKCNQPADGPPLRRRFYWHNPWLYLIILCNILIYAIVAMIVRKSGRVGICLCRRHRVRRRWFILSAWLAFLFSIVSFIAAADAANTRSAPQDAPAILVLLGIVLVLASIILGFVAARILTPARIDDRHLWLRGAGREFLATLDETGVVLRR